MLLVSHMPGWASFIVGTGHCKRYADMPVAGNVSVSCHQAPRFFAQLATCRGSADATTAHITSQPTPLLDSACSPINVQVEGDTFLSGVTRFTSY